MRMMSVVLLGTLGLSACGSSASSVQNDKSVQQTELQVEQQVKRCLPTSGGTPNPFLLRGSAERAKFELCTGVAKNAKTFDACAVKVVLGGLPTVAGLEKGLTACVEQAA